MPEKKRERTKGRSQKTKRRDIKVTKDTKIQKRKNNRCICDCDFFERERER